MAIIFGDVAAQAADSAARLCRPSRCGGGREALITVGDSWAWSNRSGIRDGEPVTRRTVAPAAAAHVLHRRDHYTIVYITDYSVS